jgi:hypothetical protein
MRRNYSYVDVAKVIYGVDKSSIEFVQLVAQIGEAMLVEALRRTGDHRISLNSQALWAPSFLAGRLMNFCGARKDPAFEDEREFRVIMCPAEQAEARVFTGVAMRKDIHLDAAGRKYIMFGEDWRPGIEPFRIIIGPKADPNIESVLKLFSWPPEVSKCEIPIR